MRRRDVASMIPLIPLALFTAVPALAFGESDVTDAFSAMMSAGSRAAQVRALKDVPSVGVVNMRLARHNRFDAELPDVSELRLFADKHRSGILRLRRALTANPVSSAAMTAHGIDVDRVVGVKISSGGSLRVFVL